MVSNNENHAQKSSGIFLELRKFKDVLKEEEDAKKKKKKKETRRRSLIFLRSLIQYN